MSEHEELSMRRSYNAAADFVDANVARGNGKKTAFKEKDRALTYGELQAASCRFGRGLEKLGLRPESRIVLLHLDTIEFPIAFWGAIRACRASLDGPPWRESRSSRAPFNSAGDSRSSNW